MLIDNNTLIQGQDLYEGVTYDFNGSVYDAASPAEVYTSAYLETQLQGTDFENDSLSVNNSECQNRKDSKTYIATRYDIVQGGSNGTNVGSGNFWSNQIGHYDAYDTFYGDTNGDNPTAGQGWTVSEAGGTVNVVSSFTGGTIHRKVVELFDNNGGAIVYGMNTFVAGAQTTGTIEYFWAQSSAAKQSGFRVRDAASNIEVYIIPDSDGNIYAYNAAVKTSLQAYSANTWYHFRVDFNTGTDKFDVYVNGVKRANQFGFNAVGGAATHCYWYSGSADANYYQYIDALDLSFGGNSEMKASAYSAYRNYNSIYSHLNFTTTIKCEQFTNVTRQLLGFNVNWWQKTNISNYIDVFVWNFNRNWWTLISHADTTTWSKLTFSNSTGTLGFPWTQCFNSTGHIRVKIEGAYNPSAEFQLNLPYFNVTIAYKLAYSVSKSFSLKNSSYRYRIHLVGSDSYSDWVWFEVIEPIANVELVSESPYYTKWDFVKTTGLTTTDLYNDHFTDLSNLWYIYGVPQKYMIFNNIPSDDAYVVDTHAITNYGSDPQCRVGNVIGDTYYSYIKYSYGSYLESNHTNSQVYLYWVSSGQIYNVYKTQDFSESTITWNNKPANIGSSLITETVSVGEMNGYWFNLVEPSFRYGFIYSSGYSYFQSTEGAHPPQIYHSISKIYQGSSGGVLYCQTNSTETLSLRSPALGLSLQSGDQIVVNFNTTSNNRIDLNLLSAGGATLESHILSTQGNTNYNDQTATFSVSSPFSVNQLEFSGLFTDTKNLQIDSVRVYRYNSQMNASYVNPQGLKVIRLDSGCDWNYSVYENGLLVKSGTLTTTSNLQTLIYTSPQYTTIYLNLYDSNNNHLNFNDYIVYVDYTAGGIAYDTVRMSSNAISVDKDTYISFSVYDSFNNLVTVYWTYATTQFIDITLSTYELKIKNERQNPISYNLTSGAISKFGNLFSNEILTIYTSAGSYIFTYTELGVSTSFSFSLTSNQIFVLNASKLCFISYQNQRGDHLSFDNFKTYVNGTLLYENIFYADIGASKLIATNDSFDISIKNTTYTVVSGDNYIPIILTQYSLKVMSQQLVFNHINITRDPNYYTSPYSWSEWIAPNEIIKFMLFPGYYKINLTNNEAGSSSYYAYTLAGDDILLIISSNTIYNVLMNLANVNTTIGNQITNVQIDLSNQNSQINNSIINVDINLGNINSTLGNLLISQGISLTNINSNISSLYVFINNSFSTVNSNMNNSFIYIESNIVAVNNSISNLISGLSSTVFLVNNSIYTAITQVGANLFLINNSIAGNLTVILQQNNFLTELYKNTMFSSLLNWSNVGTNSSLISSQINAWTFVNQYKDDSIKVMLKYNGQIDSLEVAAQDQIKQNLPKNGTEYRLWSVSEGKYISNWKALDPSDKEVDFGFYEETVPEEPEELAKSYAVLSDYAFLVILIGLIAISAITAAIYFRKKSKKAQRKADELLRTKAEVQSGWKLKSIPR